MKVRAIVLLSIVASILCLSRIEVRATGVTIPANLVAWWKGEKNMLDSKNSNDGIAYDSIDYMFGKVGYAFMFDAEDAGVGIP